MHTRAHHTVWLIVIAATATALSSAAAWADSPLTSIDISTAYADSEAVVRAAEVGLDERVAAALANGEISHGERAAIVNALGWNLGGQSNAVHFIEYVAKQRGVAVQQLTLEALSPAEAFAVGYLAAMDDYLTLAPPAVEGPLGKLAPEAILEQAKRRAPTSYTMALVHGLVVAQAALSSDWCRVYRAVHDVAEGFKAERDLRPDAEASVAEYIALYKNECRHPRPVQGP